MKPALPSPQVDELPLYRSEIRFELGLLSERLNALIGSQSFLVIAYATSMGALFQQPRASSRLALALGLALLGLALSLSAWPGIRAAHAVVQHWHLCQRALLAQAPARSGYAEALATAMHVRGRGELARFRRSTGFARQVPWLFAGAWCLFAALSLWVSLCG